MALDPGIVGHQQGPWVRSWSADESLLYAVGVGAGALDPTAELAFSTENTADIAQQAVPSYAIVLAQFGGPPLNHLAGVDMTQLLHAEQALRLHRPLPVAGSVELRSVVTGLYDKGSGALVVTETHAADPESGEQMFATRSSVFIRGEGGFGGDRGPSVGFAAPTRAADATLRFRTAPNQALIYRLSGDRNPLHTDPSFAAHGGFTRPILHGLATYGVTTRLLVNEFCGGDGSLMDSIDGRFTKPVVPGDELVVSAWREDGGVLFRTADAAGEVTIDRGHFTFREP